MLDAVRRWPGCDSATATRDRRGVDVQGKTINLHFDEKECDGTAIEECFTASVVCKIPPLASGSYSLAIDGKVFTAIDVEDGGAASCTD